MAKRRVPRISPRPRPEFQRENTTTPSTHGEVVARSPIAPDEFRRDVSPVPVALANGDVPNINPNPMPEFLLNGKPVPVPLLDDSDTD